MRTGIPARSRAALEAGVFVLLAGNTVYFGSIGETSKAVDSAAWLTLLTLFALEARRGDRFGRSRGAAWLRAARVAAAAAVVGATLRYVFDDNLLDTLNSLLWIGVVVLLEAQLRFPPATGRARTLFAGAAVTLYGMLASLVVVWAAHGGWFDAYDALAWLAAFAAIELDLSGRKVGTPAVRRG